MVSFDDDAPRERFVLYPRPIPANEGIPYVPKKKKPLPALRGWLLVASVFLLESFAFIRRIVWAGAGFSSLRRIQKLIEDNEPRHDPTVFPLARLDKTRDSESETVEEVDEIHKVSSPPPAPHQRYSVGDYRALYLAGEITPLDVVHSILPFIRRDTLPPGEHSVAWFDVNVDLAVKAAEESTLRYKENRSLGPLDGVPTAIKDEFDLEGYKTTLGSLNDYTGRIMNDEGKIDSWCVRKLAEAGAVILGKLSMHEFGMDTSGNNPFYGTPRNPYNRDYYPGGSSSGCAYAVSVGLIPMTLGSDGGGSIRIPSSFCSVVGLKPSHGRLSCYPGQNHANTCATNGPIASDIRSLAEVYSVLSQPHPSTDFHPNSEGTGKLIIDPKRPKVIGIPEVWFQKAAPSVQKLCRNTVDWLVKNKGYSVVSIDIPFLKEGQMAHAMTILTDGATLLPDPRGLSAANRTLLALGKVTPSTDYLLAQKLRRTLMQHLAWIWKTYPGMVIVTPTTSCAGWPIRSPSELKYGVSDGDLTLLTMEYVWLANFCGVPSINIPTGYVRPEGDKNAGEIDSDLDSVGKVPVGLIATGDWASEHALLQFGLDAEEATQHTQCRPPNWVDVIGLARQAKSAGF
ncbi:unnamed protein product [Clonostachys rosea]|uniref:Amidase domain-containing protein n=1 Tax=Bionectria ochroleuca TaxID=29856 RepID=A0ABY6UDJ1_BIOOC|nr:unnamed protein product [Clonostachys rosea]